MVGFAVFALCFNIIFRKNGKFPDGEIGHNKELRKRGVICMKEEDERIWGKSKHIKLTADQSCRSCDHECSLKSYISDK